MKIPETKININFKILPFGHAQIEIKGAEGEKENRLERTAEYSEPKTTNQQVIEIIFDGQEYKIPKTTGGLF